MDIDCMSRGLITFGWLSSNLAPDAPFPVEGTNYRWELVETSGVDSCSTPKLYIWPTQVDLSKRSVIIVEDYPSSASGVRVSIGSVVFVSTEFGGRIIVCLRLIFALGVGEAARIPSEGRTCSCGIMRLAHGINLILNYTSVYPFKYLIKQLTTYLFH